MITIDLPMPPSVNKIWKINKRSVGMRLSDEYQSWKANADNLCMFRRALAGHKEISTEFELEVLVDMSRLSAKADLDNRLKCLLDWLQSRDVIANDNLCVELTMKKVTAEHAPEGCRVTVKERA